MNSRLIKAYVEMSKSQKPKHSFNENKNPIALSQKSKCCLGNPKPNDKQQVLHK